MKFDEFWCFCLSVGFLLVLGWQMSSPRVTRKAPANISQTLAHTRKSIFCNFGYFVAVCFYL
jgi:hypothetical protein